ncbi:MAG: 3-deoxy-7-phosphoheptulonate synthase [Candidatus Caenarcaniphilales bacterium]|nr:3-deoxy-7-phosphoheptulonate synthase [Candidatus Caenarcaniphilales bacterium]
MKNLEKTKVFNVNIDKVDELATPKSIGEEIPITDELSEFVYQSREKVSNIIQGKDNRLVAIVGPCSIHDQELAFHYAEKLAKIRKEVGDKIELIMRVYFEKPRTSTGWKGMINDPHLNGSFHMEEGLRTARRILKTINMLGVPCATEMLDPLVPQYIADLVSWVAIGARTTESQTHREMSSGLSMPVGFKNATNGDVNVAINAIKSSRAPHSFLGIHQDEGKVAIYHTKGNPNCHIVLRGGKGGPNYCAENVSKYEEELKSAKIDSKIIIDCNHENSGKDPYKQPDVLKSILDQKQNGNESICGFMIESNIHGGNQSIPDDLTQLKYGVSITDKCLDWENTEKSIKDLAAGL